MYERDWIYCGSSIGIYSLCIYLFWSSERSDNLTLLSLVVFVGFTLSLFLSLMHKYRSVNLVISIVVLLILVYNLGNVMIPLYGILITRLLENIIDSKYAMLASCTVTALAMLIYPPDKTVVIITFTTLPMLFLVLYLIEKLDEIRKATELKNEELNALRKKNVEQKKFTQAAEYTARLQERNRLATRIHDKVGHGISGNILLLEGASMLVNRDPEKSKETIDKVLENLRGSVDDIRASLRDERSTASEAGLSEINSELSKLAMEHKNIETALVTDGDMDEIDRITWICIYENLKEAVSNLLKHSDASRFGVSITNKDKLIKAEIKDNGHISDFKTDMGLMGMEERCAMAGGRCFFSANCGFKIVMTFIIREINND